MITKFKRNNTEDLIVRQPLSSLLKSGNEHYDINYLLSKSQWCHIYEVERIDNNQIFTIGNRVALPSAPGHFIILNIKYNQNGSLILSDNLGHSIALNNAVKYIEPVQPTPFPIATVQNLDSNFFNSLETLILSKNQRQIRLEKTLKKTITNLGIKEFLCKFFEYYNDERNTIYCNDSTIQTPVNKRRSLGDIYMICKYYFPNITLKEVCKLLFIDLHNHYESGFRTSYCSQINKRVWYYHVSAPNLKGDSERNDEYGKKFQEYVNNLNS